VLRAGGAQGSAQVRAATAQVQRRKWTLERSRFGADYIGQPLVSNTFRGLSHRPHRPHPHGGR
jgi:hypothetical protein